MDSRTLTERLRGGVAAFFLSAALHRIMLEGSRLVAAQEFSSLRYSASHGWATITFCSVQLFMAVWVFSNRKYAIYLALVYASLLFVIAVLGIFWSFGPTISYITPAISLSNHIEYIMLCEYFLIMTGYLLLLGLIIWLRRLEKRNEDGI